MRCHSFPMSLFHCCLKVRASLPLLKYSVPPSRASRITAFLVHPPSQFPPSRCFSFAAAEDLVNATSEECSSKLLGTVTIEGFSDPSRLDGSAVVVESSNTVHGSERDQVSATRFAESLELLKDSTPGPQGVGTLTRLEKIIESQRQSLVKVRAQLENQRELITSILKDVSGLKSQSDKKIKGGVNLKSSSTHGERSDRIGSEDSRDSVITKDEGNKPPCWPEWTSFLEHLKSLDFIRKEQQREAEGCNSSDDPACIRRALSKFSRSHETLFDSLSRRDLQILAQYGCPTDDRRTVAAGKRLRNYLQIEEKSVCHSCVLQSSCESAFVKPANVLPKLSDVVRLIYSTIENPVTQKGVLDDDVRSSVTHLLQEITNLTVKHYEANEESNTPVSLRQVKAKATLDTEQNSDEDQDRNAKRTKLEIAKKDQGRKDVCSEEIGTRAVAQPGEWVCPRCSFLSLQFESSCVRCGLSRSGISDSRSDFNHRTTLKSNGIILSQNDNVKKARKARASSFKGHVDDKRPMNAMSNLKHDSNILQESGGEQDGMNTQHASSVRKDESSNSINELSHHSGIDEHSEIFDKILEVDDSNATSKADIHSARRNSLSDFVKENMDAFIPQRVEGQVGADWKGDCARSNVRKLKERGYRDGGYDSKSKYSSHRDDEEEDVWDGEDKPCRSGTGHSFHRREGRHSDFRGAASEYGVGQYRKGSRDNSDDDRYSSYNGKYSSQSDWSERGRKAYESRRYSRGGSEDRDFRSVGGGGKISSWERGRSQY